MTRAHWKNFSRGAQQAVVILATPSFASWLEDDTFIVECLERLTRSGVRDAKAQRAAEAPTEQNSYSDFNIDVVCACVDGLSPDVGWIPYSVGHPAREGFSFLQSRTVDILPDLWNFEDSVPSKRPTATGSLTFAKLPSVQIQAHVVLPLANTLFSNGRHSTLLVSEWTYRGKWGNEGAKTNSFVKVRSLEKSNQTIYVFDGQREAPPSIRVPAIPLTPARRIVSGLGNIVRQIDFGDEGWGPASRELETNIDEYLSTTHREKSTIAVWALIVPNGLLASQKSPPDFNLLHDTNRVKAQWQEKNPSSDFVGYWLGQGAKFCRVLSGGGGWGAKLGLLSLDPQLTFNEISEARFDFSTGSLEDQQNSALGKIAEVDAFIQFFIANATAPVVPFAKPSVHGDVWQQTTVIGAVPSTIDDQRTDEADSSTEDYITYQKGHFGAVSESGMFLSTFPAKNGNDSDQIAEDLPLHTKIDLPYSYVYRDMRVAHVPLQKKVPTQSERVHKNIASLDSSHEPVFQQVLRPSGSSKESVLAEQGRTILPEREMPSNIAPLSRNHNASAFRIRKYLTQSPAYIAYGSTVKHFVPSEHSEEPAFPQEYMHSEPHRNAQSSEAKKARRKRAKQRRNELRNPKSRSSGESSPNEKAISQQEVSRTSQFSKDDQLGSGQTKDQKDS